MKKIILILFVTFTTCTAALAQRFAYVDSDYILKHMPEYASSQKQLASVSESWQKDVDARFQEIDRLYKAYQADQVLMTPDMRKRREAEIVDKEKAAKDYQRQIFGPDGELSKKSTSLIKPIQDRVSKAIQAVAESENLDMIFDKNSEVIMLYSNPRYNKSDDVITRLGLKPGVLAK
ncbi:OmpH family outer membrane protein [Mucilaginibacter phyllosphaerae]|uniref:Outer membrane protein n=1 Tax=Mucilaginibacter phyllosphaerae TaxID=1812349 RepID=A0A4Y8AL42_9SPHI|nr:OmpH family outer membrane protein [Mucilaginibacter phyllosphaerae]MBB3967777.1 outer membrane protein [Mucilaginibacter phyllosphaerae]TEW69175.1 OmpH family outer membrane protein [Mucilaginibacter phyllosphaerae]GGH03401.1 membrane protein [Mucilaginibacter phyllosphaerae]